MRGAGIERWWESDSASSQPAAGGGMGLQSTGLCGKIFPAPGAHATLGESVNKADTIEQVQKSEDDSPLAKRFETKDTRDLRRVIFAVSQRSCGSNK